jgi:hypothetical protein
MYRTQTQRRNPRLRVPRKLKNQPLRRAFPLTVALMERALTVGFPYLDAQKVVLVLMAAKVGSLSLALQTEVIRGLMALTVFKD